MRRAISSSSCIISLCIISLHSYNSRYTRQVLPRSFSSVQSLSHVWLFVTPWTVARQASLSITNSWSLLRLMSIESVMLTPSYQGRNWSLRKLSHLSEITQLGAVVLGGVPHSFCLFKISPEEVQHHQRANSSTAPAPQVPWPNGQILRQRILVTRASCTIKIAEFAI